ncbi:hypothetical protein Tco_1547397 [Tanacetum coccineum]
MDFYFGLFVGLNGVKRPKGILVFSSSIVRAKWSFSFKLLSFSSLSCLFLTTVLIRLLILASNLSLDHLSLHFLYDSPACLLLEQGTPSCSEESINTVNSSHDMKNLKGSQDDEVGSHLLENVVSRWHVYKPIHISFVDCKKDCGQWPTCNPDLSFCSGYDAIYEQEKSEMLKQWICFRDHERQNVRGNGMIFADFLKVRATEYADPNDFNHEYPHPYIPQKSDSPSNDTLRINAYFPDVFQTQLKKPRLRDNSFEEWVKIKTRDDPYSRRFDVYKQEFDYEIEQLENKYELKAKRKRYALDEVWEKCEKFHDTTKIWYDKGFEEEEL